MDFFRKEHNSVYYFFYKREHHAVPLRVETTGSSAPGFDIWTASVRKATFGVVVNAGQFVANSAANDFVMRIDGGGHFIFADNVGGTQLMKIQQNGNVGVGTTDPATRLHVHSAGTSTFFNVTNATTGALSTDGLTIGYDDALGAVLVNREAGALVMGTSGAERMRIAPGGEVGIGTTTPGYTLHVIGDIQASGCVRAGVSTLGGSCSSDAALKTDVQSFSLGMEALEGIQPHMFRYNGLGEHPKSEALELGVIAQEVEKTAPELISRKKVYLHPGDKEKTEIRQVNYSAFTYVLINAVKEFYKSWKEDSSALHQEIDLLKKENQALSEQNQRMMQQLDEISRRISNVEEKQK